MIVTKNKYFILIFEVASMLWFAITPLYALYRETFPFLSSEF